MKFDDASWHYGGDFPKDLPDEAGATHAGMFLVWALFAGIGGEIHIEEAQDEVARLQSRESLPVNSFCANAMES